MPLSEAIEQLLDEGSTSLELYPQENVSWRLLTREAHRIPFWAKRSVKDWQRTKRATFFAAQTGLVSRLLSAQLWAPNADSIRKLLQASLREQAVQTKTPSLATNFNRIGFNFMAGKPGEPARIPPHQDPESLVGVVAVLNLEGSDTGSLAQEPGSLALIACRNLCEVRGIEPVTHSVTTTEHRTSLTFAQLQS